VNLFLMDKGSFKKYSLPHDAPLQKVTTLVVTTGMLVTMIAIDASASPNNAIPSITRPSSSISSSAVNGSLSQIFGLGRNHSPQKSSASTTTTGVSKGGSSGTKGGSSAQGRVERHQGRFERHQGGFERQWGRHNQHLFLRIGRSYDDDHSSLIDHVDHVDHTAISNDNDDAARFGPGIRVPARRGQ